MKRGNIHQSSQWWNPDLDPSDVVGKGWVFFGSSKATPDPPTVSVSSSTNTQIDLAWTPGLVFRWNLEMAMGDVCFFVVRYLFFNSNTHSDHGEQYDFVFLLWIFESKLKTYYFHMIHDIPWHTWWSLQNGEMKITRCHSMADGFHPNDESFFVGRFWWWLNDHRMVRLWFDSPLTQKGGESKLRNILVSVCVFQAIGAIGLVGVQRFSYIF